jgi:hypothetical protein
MSNIPNFSDQQNNKLELMFGDLPQETEIFVKLPSLGKFYTNKVSDVKIKPIKFEDEKHLSVALKNDQNPVNFILGRCVQGIDIASLLILDKLFLLLKIREISYGAEYPASIVCPSCDTESDVNIDLSQMLVNYVTDDILDPREITLPRLNKKVIVRFPRVSDEQWLDNIKTTYDNIYRFIISFDGVTDPVFISKALNHPKMPLVDVKFILKEIVKNELGLNPKFLLECGHCGKESQMEVPVSENFFSVI